MWWIQTPCAEWQCAHEDSVDRDRCLWLSEPQALMWYSVGGSWLWHSGEGDIWLQLCHRPSQPRGRCPAMETGNTSEWGTPRRGWIGSGFGCIAAFLVQWKRWSMCPRWTGCLWRLTRGCRGWRSSRWRAWWVQSPPQQPGPWTGTDRRGGADIWALLHLQCL